MTITSANFTNNTISGENGLGGGIFSYNCSLILSKVKFSENRCKSNRGGVYAERGSLSVENSLMTKNHAKMSRGAIYCLEVSNISVLEADLNTAV